MSNKEIMYALLNRLSYKAIKLYLLMMNEKQLGEFSIDFRDKYKKVFGYSDATFQEARKELIRYNLVK